MNQFKYVFILLLTIVILSPTDLYGQKKKKEKPVKNSPVISYIHGYAGAGYSVLMHDITAFPGGIEARTPGGGAGVLGFGYTLKHRKNPFIFKTGLEFMFLNSSIRTDSIRYQSDFRYTDVNNPSGIDMVYYMNFNNYVEKQNRFSAGLPIMFGAQFDKVYFTLGAKIVLGLVNNYYVKSDLTTYAKDPTLIGDLENMPTHTFQTSSRDNKNPIKYNNNLNLGLDITGSAEIGVILDEWMPKNWRIVEGKNKKKTKLTYRAGLFADYGILNINTNKPALDDEIHGFKGIVPAEKIHSEMQPNSIFQSKEAYISENNPTPINSLVVGAKFEVMVQVSPEPVKRKKVRKKPAPKPPKKNLPDPPYFFAVVMDYDTEQYLEADLKLFKLTEPNDTVLAATTLAENGYTEARLKSDRFGIVVKKPGYVTYRDTIWQINNDTVFIELQPIKENTIIILENLNFETAKTVVKNEASTVSLNEMYKLLVENPGLKIEISGHTDNVGSARYNKRLSEGRAKAIYQIMIDRGIDANRMTWRGGGEDEPIESNDTEEGRAANRRVEFRITENNISTMIFKKAEEAEKAEETEIK